MNQPSVPVQYSTQDKVKLAGIGVVCCLLGTALYWFTPLPFGGAGNTLGLLWSSAFNKRFLAGSIPGFLPQQILKSEKYGDATAATTAMMFGFIASMMLIVVLTFIKNYHLVN